MLTTGFREQHERKLKVPASSDALNEFVKFLYGLDLDRNLPLVTIKELIQIGGVYDDSVRTAAWHLLRKHFTKENIFELLQFCKTLDAKIIMDTCKEFIVNAFKMKDLIKKNLLKDHPEIALDILLDIQCEKDHISIARLHTKIKKVR